MPPEPMLNAIMPSISNGDIELIAAPEFCC
jgi:hypothetical protein